MAEELQQKEENKQEIKEETSKENNEETKDESKEEIKEEVKEESKEKKEDESEENKNETKEETKDESEEEIKEETQEEIKEESEEEKKEKVDEKYHYHFDDVVINSAKEYIDLIEKKYAPNAIRVKKDILYKKIFKLICSNTRKKPIYRLYKAYFLSRSLGTPCYPDDIRTILRNYKDKEEPLLNYLYGEAFRYGYGLKVSDKKAYYYFNEAVKKNYAPAMVSLSEFHLYGKFVDEDEKTAYHLLDRASDLEYCPALILKARYLYNGVGIEADKNEASQIIVSLYNKAYPRSYFYYGMLLLDDENNKKDAYKTFKEGLKLNDYACKIGLAVCHLIKAGIGKNYNKAKKILVKCCDEYHFDACYYIGVMLFNGLGYRKSYEGAYEVFDLGSAHGCLKSRMIIKDRYKVKRRSAKVKRDKKLPIPLNFGI